MESHQELESRGRDVHAEHLTETTFCGRDVLDGGDVHGDAHLAAAGNVDRQLDGRGRVVLFLLRARVRVVARVVAGSSG